MNSKALNSIKRLAMISLVVASFLLVANLAHAVVIDYATLANTAPGDGSYDPLTVVASDGTVVDATGTNVAGNVDYYAYLDATWDGRVAGLGVCKVATTGLCVPSDDDNVTFDEMLTLEFDKMVDISQILFRDGNHFTTFTYADNDFDLYIDDIFDSSYTLQGVFNTVLSGTKFSFVGSSVITDLDQFYIQAITFTPVPEPSTYLLLGSGILGLAFWRRRKSRR